MHGLLCLQDLGSNTVQAAMATPPRSVEGHTTMAGDAHSLGAEAEVGCVQRKMEQLGLELLPGGVGGSGEDLLGARPWLELFW